MTGQIHHVWRSDNGVDYHFDRWIDYQGEHFQCKTQDHVSIAYELNPGVPFLQWCVKIISSSDAG